MTKKLIALAIDGTLLDPHGKIAESSKRIVKRALNHGIKVVLCSSRPIDGLKEYLVELGIMGSAQYVVTLNGAITRNTDDDIITENLVPNSYYRRMTAFGMANKIPFNIVDAESRIITADHNVDPMIYHQAYENHSSLYIRNPDQLPEDNIRIAKGCFVGNPKMLNQWDKEIRKEFGKELYIVRSGPSRIELLNAEVNKGYALKQLCEKLDIMPENVIAIGDERNDIPMFNFAGISICMKNGSEEAKVACDYVTAANDDDGVAKALKKFVFND